VPDLGWKQDAVPGFINDGWTELTEPGVYRGKCAELCGKDHGFMPIVAAAAATKTWGMDDLMAQGEQVYAKNCAACHQAEGQGIPGVFPAIAGSAIATGPLDGHTDIVLNGKTGSTMPAFAAQLNDVDIAAVLTYQRNAFGNATGDMVQPSDIAASR
jgi:cytochrome c oxidase subunit 2